MEIVDPVWTYGPPPRAVGRVTVLSRQPTAVKLREGVRGARCELDIKCIPLPYKTPSRSLLNTPSSGPCVGGQWPIACGSSDGAADASQALLPRRDLQVQTSSHPHASRAAPANTPEFCSLEHGETAPAGTSAHCRTAADVTCGWQLWTTSADRQHLVAITNVPQPAARVLEKQHPFSTIAAKIEIPVQAQWQQHHGRCRIHVAGSPLALRPAGAPLTLIT